MFVFPFSPCKKGQRRWVEYSDFLNFAYMVSLSNQKIPHLRYGQMIVIVILKKQLC